MGGMTSFDQVLLAVVLFPVNGIAACSTRKLSVTYIELFLRLIIFSAY